MKIPLLYKLCIVLSLVILSLAVYLLTSSTAPEPARLSEAGPTTATPEPVVVPSPDPLPAVAESEAGEPAPAPGGRIATGSQTAAAAPLQHKGLAARRVAAGASAAATPAAPATSGNAPDAADLGGNAPLPVPLPSAIVSGEVQAALPLALVPPNPDQQLSDLQQMGMDSLRKGFIDAVGGPDQDPKDPEYLRRWQAATNQSDDLFKTMFGWKAYAEQQRRAVMEAGGVKAYFEQLAAAQQPKK